MGRTTRPTLMGTPSDEFDLTRMIQGLRGKIRELRPVQTLTPAVRNLVENTASPFTVNVLVEEIVDDFHLPNDPLKDENEEIVVDNHATSVPSHLHGHHLRVISETS